MNVIPDPATGGPSSYCTPSQSQGLWGFRTHLHKDFLRTPLHLIHLYGGDEGRGQKSTRTAIKRTFLSCTTLCPTSHSLTKYQTIKFRVHGHLSDFAQADKILADEKLEGQKKVTTVDNLPENRSDLLLQDKIPNTQFKTCLSFYLPKFWLDKIWTRHAPNMYKCETDKSLTSYAFKATK